MESEIACEVCGRSCTAYTSKRRYCSGRCRAAHSRTSRGLVWVALDRATITALDALARPRGMSRAQVIAALVSSTAPRDARS